MVACVVVNVACTGTRRDAGETVGKACWRGRNWWWVGLGGRPPWWSGVGSGQEPIGFWMWNGWQLPFRKIVWGQNYLGGISGWGWLGVKQDWLWLGNCWRGYYVHGCSFYSLLLNMLENFHNKSKLCSTEIKMTVGIVNFNISSCSNGL